MADGSMVLTREKNESGQCEWAEIKLGRVFRLADHLSSGPEQASRHWIKESRYVAHLRDCDTFFARFMPLLDPLQALIFIADGALWIWQRVQAYYPDAVQILDCPATRFFHALEYLYKLLGLCWKDNFEHQGQQQDWAQKQKQLLLESQVGQVIANIEALQASSLPAKEEKHKLLTYYHNNQSRMQYAEYLKKGWLIGSGPIESAHREVIQKRMKQSGQRWSRQGAQQMANLRVAYRSNQWHTIVDDIKLCT